MLVFPLEQLCLRTHLIVSQSSDEDDAPATEQSAPIAPVVDMPFTLEEPSMVADHEELQFPILISDV